MKNAVQIDFQLLGTTISPKEISKTTGIAPDTELMRGERNPKLTLPRGNIWSVMSHVDSDDVADHWRFLELKLSDAKEEIRAIAKTGTAKFTLIINSSQRVPPIAIPSSMSAFAGFLDAVIDIDHLQ